MIRGAAWILFAAAAAAQAQTIVIDPGHPSEVGMGTRGKHLTEVAVAWQTATLLAERLRGKGYRVVLTKSWEREFVPNRRRAEIANEARADLLLRLHLDAAKGRGYAFYHPDRVGTAADGKRGPSAKVLRESARATRLLYRHYTQALAELLPGNGVKTDRQTAVGARQGALTGSIFSQVPVCLIELAVLTNPQDEAVLRRPGGLARIADALTVAIVRTIPRRAAVSHRK
jgi:N-acetylmuramoyl-L-alanine amidase